MTAPGLPRLQPPLSLRWDFPGGSGVPLVAGERVLVPCGRAGLVCLETSTGQEVWRAPGRHGPAGMAVQGDRVLAVVEEARSERFLVEYEAGTGEVRRRVPVRHSLRVLLPETRSFIGWSAHVEAAAGTSITSVARLHIDEPRHEEWRLERETTPDRPEDRFDSAITAGDGLVFTQLGTDIVALSSADGTRVWTFSIAPWGPQDLGRWDPLVWGNLVLATVAGGPGHTLAVNRATGNLAWIVPHAGPRAATAERVYVVAASGLATIDARGREATVDLAGMIGDRWGLEDIAFTTRLALSESHAWLGDRPGHLYAVDLGNGDPVWRHRPDDSTGFLGTTPVIEAGRLFVTSFSSDRRAPSRLYCYESSDAPGAA